MLKLAIHGQTSKNHTLVIDAAESRALQAKVKENQALIAHWRQSRTQLNIREPFTESAHYSQGNARHVFDINQTLFTSPSHSISDLCTQIKIKPSYLSNSN